MLTPAPSVCQALADSSNSYSNLIPSTLLLSDAAWLSISGEYNNSQHHNHHSHRHQRSSPNARLSKLSKTTQHSRHSRLHHRQNHHHHDRPSRQFIATTSSAIFGDWDIDIKVDRRTLARLKKTEEAAAVGGGGRRVPSATVAAAGGEGGGRGGGAGGRASITLGPGPGIHTGASGMQPLSTLPSAFSSSATSSTPPQTSGANTNSTTAPYVLKGQRHSSNKSTTDNTPSFPSSSSASPTVLTPPSTSSPKNNNPSSAGDPQKKTNGTTPATKPIITTTASTPTGSKVQDVSNALVAPSARSSFLKALGKFKSKHLQQKRSSTPPAIVAIDTPATLSDRRASYIIPPIQFDNQENDKLVSNVLESSSSTSPEVPAQVAHVQFENVPTSDEPTLEGTSSLRIKLKNRMSSTLASMKSSSNLRDKAKAQQQLSTSGNTASQSAASIKSNEHRQSAVVALSSSTEEPQHQQQQGTDSNVSSSTTSGSGKNRQSKTFWTFPRVRLEPSQGSKRQPNSFDTLAAASTAVAAAAQNDLDVEDVAMLSTETKPAEDGVTSLHEQLEELKVEELDSDHSLDIILPGDYEDYTQFAELPLKKRKKLERSLAAAAAAAANGEQSNKRDSSVRAGADAMKRFLTLQRKDTSTTTTAADGGTTEEVVMEHDLRTSANSKKRPPSSTETRGSVAKRTGQHASEWRRSIMKSLHIGKNQQGSNKSGAAAAASASLGTVTESAQGSGTAAADADAVVEPVQPLTSDSVVSIRSRSLTTSTHPALLATTIVKPRTPGLRRETLEMAMRRRRQSSVARSNISDTDIPSSLPRSSDFFNLDNYSTTNVTHTFTSFTLELADMYAREVVNNSATPGLFNFKRRQSRLTVSSHVGMDIDTDQDFRGFDSDGDAISGYTGDADISMEEIHVRPKTPTAPRPSSGLFKTRARESNAMPTDMFPRRKISSVDGDSDTVSELPSLMIRTRDLNRSSGGFSSKPRPVSGSSFEMDYDQQGNAAAAEASSPRSPRRAGGTVSPAFQRKTSRGIVTLNSVAEGGSSASDSPSAKSLRGTAPMSMEEVASWKPRNVYSQQQQQHPRPYVPTLDTKPLKPTRGSGLSSSTTLVPSSRTPHSAALLSQSPRALSPTYESLDRGIHHHQQFSSSSSSYRQHPNHPSADTLVPSHLKNGSNMSTGSGYSGRTLLGYGQQLRRGISTMEVEEFDPSEDFPPTTPADLKSLDFEALLATAEKEHQKGWDDLKLQKKVSGQPTIPPVFASLTLSPPTSTSSSSSSQPSSSSPMFSPIQPLKIASSASKANRQSPPSSQQLAPPQRSTVAFDLGPSDDGGTGTGTGTGSDRSMRSKRVMKKKMSVIRLTGNGNGNIQGRREDDGVIRVSMSPTPHSPSNSPSPLMMHREREVVDSSSPSRSYS
ncbi:hypothetical protein BG015_010211 [Linnemannia schmuckeri]|uniref:Uncharacterized protein n=1 Tax=Linnemannia schmuckeri TaxID=64567 RepID=A0A9P5RUV8_9FUNG|nr:hypothetical protein BG015_010211 [Linnemannia schmuckeri]